MQRAMIIVLMSLWLAACGNADKLIGMVLPSPTPLSRYAMASHLCDEYSFDFSLFPTRDENGHRGYKITVSNNTSESSLQNAACILDQMEVPLYITDKITSTREEGVEYKEKINDLDISWIKNYNRLSITVIDLRD